MSRTFSRLSLFLALLWMSVTDAAESGDPSIDSLLQDLAQANLMEKVSILEQLETSGGRDMLPLFQTMLQGDLYFDEASGRMVRLVEDGEDAMTATDALTGESLESVVEDQVVDIRVNNLLRMRLTESIARVELMEGDVSQRREAARSMLDDINGRSVNLLREARESETQESVLKIINTGLAMHRLTLADDRQERLDAIALLEQRLERPVLNLLERYTPDGSAGETDTAVAGAAAEAVENIERRSRFYRFIEQLLFGLSLGSVLFLAAVGLSVTFGVMGVINMAHGEMLMLGAYTTYVIQQAMPGLIAHSLWLAIPAAFLVAASVGILIQRLVIRHLNGRPLETLLATFGISLILQQTVRVVFSPLNQRVVSPEWMSGSIEINPVLSLTNNRLFIFFFALIILALLMFILKKTSLGLNVRAVSQNRNMAKAMGIRTEWVDAMTFGLGSGIAGIGGVALSQLTNVGPNLGQAYIVDSFMVVVFGGAGNLLGTVVGAFSLGTARMFIEPSMGAVLANILFLLFIIVFIQFRPKGLFPQRGRAAE